MNISPGYQSFLEGLLDFCRSKSYSQRKFEVGDRVSRWTLTPQGKAVEDVGYVVGYYLQLDDDGGFEWECTCIWDDHPELTKRHPLWMEEEPEKNLHIYREHACKPLKLEDYRNVG